MAAARETVLPSIASSRAWLRATLADMHEQGYATEGIEIPDSYDGIVSLARRLEDIPLREDWPYVEPTQYAAIEQECDPARPLDALGSGDLRARAEAAFLGRVAGCMLGKPFEIAATLAELRDALSPVGEWPLTDYLSERGIERLRERQGQWPELVRERITHVAPDDDINYTIIGMLALEQRGLAFTQEDLRALWSFNLPARVTFGPERTAVVADAMRLLTDGEVIDLGNPGAELCGALIRVDAYAYAALGRPALAAELAWRDASMTHRGTGLYAAMFVAAAIAAAPFREDPLDIFRIALGFIPQRSRFADTVRTSIAQIEAAGDWLDGYERIHRLFGDHGHCRITQEIGTLINTVTFAGDVGEGICIQVMQGNDTDSFGATAGSVLGARWGHVDLRWIAPFRDDLHTALAMFHERSLEAVAARMAALAGIG